ncbi:Aste57867_24490 [Aphanomyces stellatus]|uniref:Aste57867_24490 protein n=1 Tax=Aphanomyces stellatus TaxID=120398 RepID=A0A485LUV4_9STRA|nr:hypothetical protein As57867_024413 [Aphanomyces stellatus]VFU01129.1 Aste57867_24490 [Aphanomyces stellatus]
MRNRSLQFVTEAVSAASSSMSGFSTRFLPSDGIPEYNALLDDNLGRHRTFLLGSKSSLKLLQKTGAVAKVEPGTSDDQYVVYLDSPKPKRKVEKGQATKKVHLARRKPKPTTSNPCDDTTDEMTTTSVACLPDTPPRPKLHRSATEALGVRAKRTEKIEPLVDRPKPPLPSPCTIKRIHKSASEVMSKSKWKKPPHGGLHAHPAHEEPKMEKPVVNHLLESDVAYHEKIERFKARLDELDVEKKAVTAEITHLRKALRGVNAVHDNDMAVAHCHAVVQHRLAKAQEEFMKVLTQQAAIRASIDVVRRELLALAQVRRKLTLDLDDANKRIASAEGRINHAKTVQKNTFLELSTLERQAEADAVERILKLPPEEDMVTMDIPNLMQSMHDRASSRKLQDEEAKRASQQAASPQKSDGSEFETTYKNAFQMIQLAVQAPPIDEFVASFVDMEDQLISMYTHHQFLQSETKKAKAVLEALQAEARGVRLRVRAQDDDVASRKVALREKIDQVNHKAGEFEALHRRQAVDHEALRVPILHLLEVLKADKHFMQSSGFVDPIQEMPLPNILGIAQERIVEFAILSQVQAKQADVAKAKAQAVERFNQRRRTANVFVRGSADSPPTLSPSIVVGPRVPTAAASLSNSPPSFDTIAGAATLPGLLSAESSLDSTIPLSSYQLFNRALRQDDD